MTLRLEQLAQELDLEVRGDGGIEISGVATAASANPGDICFVTHNRYLDQVLASTCAAVILPRALAATADSKPVLVSETPQYHFSRVIELLGLEPNDALTPGIHPSAQIAASARIGEGARIGALVVVEDEVEIGERSVIGAGSVIERAAMIGSDCRIHSRVTLARAVRLGKRCIVHAGAVIGADGFGLVMQDDAWHKIPQLGSVLIEDDVEIGANTTIDRGALDDTIIERGCKLDNQIQVAHNVHIGAHTAIAACVGIAGSATIGRYCKISGAAVVLGHLNVADNVTITAMSLVTKDVKQAGVYSSGTPLMENSRWHRANARYKALDELAQKLSRLEKSSD